MKSITKTAAQARWLPASEAYQRVLDALAAVETIGHAEHAGLAARVKAEAATLLAKQDRSARVSLADCEDAVAGRVVEEVRTSVRTKANAARKTFETAISGLKALAEEQRRVVRQHPRPPASLAELNARLELADHSLDELLAVAADPAADDARRFVAEASATRALAKPVTYPSPDDFRGDQVGFHRARRAVDQTRAAHVAKLEAITGARVPAEVKAREAADTEAIAQIEKRWTRLRSPLGIIENSGQAMPLPGSVDLEQQEHLAAAHDALIKAIEIETLTEAGYREAVTA